jgi:CheY-like chemotaxis protein
MDGIAAVQIIRHEIGTEYAKTVPIIALTANVISGNEELFLKNGFQAFLSKPIDVLSLDGVINRYIRDKKIEKELPFAGAPPQPIIVESKPGAKLFSGASPEDVNFSEGLKRFNNNEETYLQLLQSYLALIRSATAKIREYTQETHSVYALTVHSLKSTSYTIGADSIGQKAEALEAAAHSGDVNFIKTHNKTLIDALEALIPKLENVLEGIKNQNQKPSRPAPDPALLAKILEACTTYNMEQLDAAVDELELYRYESQSDLVEWIREQVNISELEKIRERLLAL